MHIRHPHRLWLIIAAALAATSAAWAADRAVLQELVTRIGCTYCPNAGNATEALLNAYPGSFLSIQYHRNDAVGTAFGSQRTYNFYGMFGEPMAQFDGLSKCSGAQTVSIAQTCYTDKYLERLAVPTDVVIQLGGAALPGDRYSISTKISREPGGEPRTMRLYVAQVLDHFPAEPSYSRNTFRRILPTVDVTLAPGETRVLTGVFEFGDPNVPQAPELLQPHNIKIIAWVQAPADIGPAEVYQAAEMTWPFPIMDCNSNGVPDEFDINGGGSADSNGDGIPDDCQGPPVCRADANCDGSVTWRDIDYFIAGMNDNQPAWRARFPPPGPACPFASLDVNGDGSVSWRDIDPFIQRLNSTCSPP